MLCCLSRSVAEHLSTFDFTRSSSEQLLPTYLYELNYRMAVANMRRAHKYIQPAYIRTLGQILLVHYSTTYALVDSTNASGLDGPVNQHQTVSIHNIIGQRQPQSSLRLARKPQEVSTMYFVEHKDYASRERLDNHCHRHLLCLAPRKKCDEMDPGCRTELFQVLFSFLGRRNH